MKRVLQFGVKFPAGVEAALLRAGIAVDGGLSLVHPRHLGGSQLPDGMVADADQAAGDAALTAGRR